MKTKKTKVQRLCNHINRVPLALGRGHTVIGGVSVGHCEKPAFPGLMCCYEHATKEALAYMVRVLLSDFQKATKRKHHFEVPPS